MKKLTVDGITFKTTKEAKAAERELESIQKIRGLMDVTNPVYAKVLHEKLIEKGMLHTKVGDKFLAELQGYFGPEAAREGEDAAVTEDGTATAELTEAEKAENTIPYLNEAMQAEAGTETPAGAEHSGDAGEQSDGEPSDSRLQEEEVSDEIPAGADFGEMSPEDTAVNRTEQGTVSTDTGTLEGILNGAIFDEDDLISFAESSDAAEADSAKAGSTHSTIDEEDLPEEYFGATGLDALVEEYSETETVEAAEAESEPAEKQQEETEEAGEDDAADLDAFMAEYGITDALDPEKNFEGEAQPEEEDGELDVAELDALMEGFSESSVEAENEAGATEPPINLNLEGREEQGRPEDGGFHLELDDADLYDEPDDDALLAEARTLKKELHQEDLSEVFSEQDEQPEKKHFSLYGVLIVSVILNVVLIASMAIMVQVFKNSDNRNILNYERILEQEYQTATPTDAEEAAGEEN